MATRLPTKAQFDALLPELQACTRAWAQRECTSLDDAVQQQPSGKTDTGEGSIWDMPAIDSKRVVSLLVELETVFGGGCKLPVAVIKSGGYASSDDLIARLFPKLRDACTDAQKPGLASTAASTAVSTLPPAQVLP